MDRVRGRVVTIVAGACLVATLIAVPSAQAAVTASQIATPKDKSYIVYDYAKGNTLAVSGTTNGTTGDHVDLACYYGNSSKSIATNVTVQAGGSFSAPAADLTTPPNPPYAPCRLRAIPAGTTPANVTPFAGPLLFLGVNRVDTVSGGPNNGKTYDYYSYFQQLGGGFDYDSIASCGVDDGYLSDSTFALTTVTFWCNAALFYLKSGSTIRSELQIDGQNAYPSRAAKTINANAIGLRTMTYSYSLDRKTGNVVIHETAPMVRCADPAYPPTTSSCAAFVGTGVTDVRTIVQDHFGRVAWVTDVFKSTDGNTHKLDLLWDNNQRFWRNQTNPNGDASQIEYEFPGESGYSLHVVDDTVSLPAKPGTILIRVHGAADGDTTAGRGAIVYDRAADRATFRSVSKSNEAFMLHQTAKVPANGSTRFRFGYVHAYSQALVGELAQFASVVFKGCTVPKVTGKPLAAAKRALTRAHCTVGKIKRAFSATVRRGSVIAQKPKARRHLDYGGKIALVVSKGRR